MFLKCADSFLPTDNRASSFASIVGIPPSIVASFAMTNPFPEMRGTTRCRLSVFFDGSRGVEPKAGSTVQRPVSVPRIFQLGRRVPFQIGFSSWAKNRILPSISLRAKKRVKRRHSKIVGQRSVKRTTISKFYETE